MTALVKLLLAPVSLLAIAATVMGTCYEHLGYRCVISGDGGKVECEQNLQPDGYHIPDQCAISVVEMQEFLELLGGCPIYIDYTFEPICAVTPQETHCVTLPDAWYESVRVWYVCPEEHCEYWFDEFFGTGDGQDTEEGCE